MCSQLYVEIENALVPASVAPIGFNKYRVRSRKYSNFVLATWPDGRPCHLANHWLHSVCSKTTAKETPRVYASLISHLLRYCSLINVELWDFTDDLFYDFTNALLQEQILVDGVREPKRGRTHIRTIQLRCLYFLLWISENFSFLSVQPLIGESGCSPQITITFKRNPHTGHLEIYHSDLVSPAPPIDDKGVITEKAIQSVQDAIFRHHNIQELPARALTKLKHDPSFFHILNTYIYERRMFMIRMMKLTGLRPEELIDIPLSLNLEVLTKLYISIPTKKREYPAPIRKFRVNSRAAMDFDRYITQRKDFLRALVERGSIKSIPDSLLLTVQGSPLKKSSMTKDFDRLCISAGLGDVRACLSMFRHRFVTREIHILLIERFEKHPDLQIAWTAALRDDICFIVAQKTGHKHPASLHVYFHEEYRLLTKDPEEVLMRKNVEILDESQDALIDLKFQNQLTPSNSMADEISKIQSNIDRLYAKIFG